MSILSGPEIERRIDIGQIRIDPLRREHIGPNSVDLTLAPIVRRAIFAMAAPKRVIPAERAQPASSDKFNAEEYFAWLAEGSNPPFVDPEVPERSTLRFETIDLRDHPDGLICNPGEFLLGSTVETTQCDGLVPCIETKSTYARCGASMHESAGFGDDGFCGAWTLEISPKLPIALRPFVRVCQVYFMTVEGRSRTYRGRYQNQQGATLARPAIT